MLFIIIICLENFNLKILNFHFNIFLIIFFFLFIFFLNSNFVQFKSSSIKEFFIIKKIILFFILIFLFYFLFSIKKISKIKVKFIKI